MASSVALSRLLQLASPMLPVGAYCYSQGLEWAIECGDVKDLESAKTWIGDVLQPIKPILNCLCLHLLYQAWQAGDLQSVHEWDAFYKAGRDTAEGLAETKQMGYSLVRLLNDLKELPDDLLSSVKMLKEPAFPTIYAAVAQYWQIPAQDMLQGYAWGWLENQASACHEICAIRASGRAKDFTCAG